MAAAALPLVGEIVGAALPIITPLIKDMILHVESIFGAGTGATKKNTVVNGLIPVLNNLANLPAGSLNKLPGTIDPTTIENLVELFVQTMKASGELTTPDAAVATIKAQGQAQSATAAPVSAAAQPKLWILSGGTVTPVG